MKCVTIYTDGACSGNPGPGGWGAVLSYNSYQKEISGFEASTTNNRMELTAAIKALELLKEPCEVSLYSDSAYLINGFTKGWVYNWEKKNWKKDKEKPVLNPELWKSLLSFSRKHKITWIKVKGHADNPLNNRCDLLATSAIKNHKNQH